MNRIIISIMLTLSVFACSDVLEKKPLDMISDSDVWNDANLIDAYLIGVYNRMPFILGDTPERADEDYYRSFGWGGACMINDASDECRNNFITYDGCYTKYLDIGIGGGWNFHCWDNAYKAIRALNDLIIRVPESTILRDDVKKSKVSEARFLRAYNYFHLVKRYGGVPLIIRVQDIDDSYEELYPARNSEKEIYDFIISEMDDIEGELGDNVSTGRPTNTTALALKCRAALYAGSIAQFGYMQLDGILGINVSEANDYYQKAYDAATQIMTEKKHSLYDRDDDKVQNFKNIFLVKCDANNPEPIWVVRHNSNTALWGGGCGWGWDFFQCPPPQAWGAGGNQNNVYLEMVESFELVDGTSGKLDYDEIQQGVWTTEELWKDREPRFFASLYTMNTPWQGGYVDWHLGIMNDKGEIIREEGAINGFPIYGRGKRENSSCFGVMKYLDESHDNMDGDAGRLSSSTDWQIFRYAEVLLNYAEAAFELGKTDDALDAINELRDRAGVAQRTSINREQIRHERKVELAFEGHRYWDLRRWRIAYDELNIIRKGLQYVLDITSTDPSTAPIVMPEYKLKIEIIDNAEYSSMQPVFQIYYYYLPITLAKTGANPNLKENPGYR